VKSWLLRIFNNEKNTRNTIIIINGSNDIIKTLKYTSELLAYPNPVSLKKQSNDIKLSAESPTVSNAPKNWDKYLGHLRLNADAVATI
jgi:hypothetical protein